MTVERNRVEELATRLETVLSATTPQEALVPERRVDLELPLDDLDERLVSELDRLEPYGTSNPEPTFLARGVRVRSRAVVGGSHLKLLLQSGKRALSAIGFGMADREVSEGDEVEMLYRPRISEWGGQRNLEVEIRDLRRP
jgi:single-stranded-DNA-specific exonuclease